MNLKPLSAALLLAIFAPMVSCRSPEPAAAAPAPDHPRPQANLKDAVAQAIRVFEARDFVATLKYVNNPANLAFAPEVNGQPATVEQYAELLRQSPNARERMALLAIALKSVQNTEADLSDNGRRALYLVDPPVVDFDSLTFTKENGAWYLLQGLE